jgi:signal transduction histidine kinase
MKRFWAGAGPILENTLHLAILGVLLAYTYAVLFEIPHRGFDLDVDGHVVDIFVQGNPDNPLQIGDRLLQVGELTWADFRGDYQAMLFKGLQPGEIVSIRVEREGLQYTIPWSFPGTNPREFTRYALSGFWLGYFFWLAGLMTAIHLRPKGESWALAVAFNYFAALGCILGGDVSFNHVWYSSYLFSINFWLAVPMFLHFHWVWPSPLARLPAAAVWIGYGAGAALAVAQCLQLLPQAALLGGFIAAIGGSLVFLALHGILQPAMRRNMRWVVIIVALAVLPVGTYPVLAQYVGSGVANSIALVGLPLIPMAYFGAIHRRQLGAIEFRVNKVLSVYLFLVLLGTLMLPILILGAIQTSDRIAVLVFAVMAGILSAVAAIFGFPLLQSFLERRFFRLPASSSSIVGTYAARITGCTSLPELGSLLSQQVLPSLLVRQFAFMHFDEGRTVPVLVTGLDDKHIPDAAALRELRQDAGRDRRVMQSAETVPYLWIRVVVPLTIRDEQIGVWLLGDRHPDDAYTRADIEVIQSLGNQTAIALSNIIQTERVRELYRANVTRTEEERLQLAHALHDRVLNQLAALLMRLDDPSITPAVLKSFEEFSNRVREIVADLRPPMLVYGLRPALAELVETLAERPPQQVSFSLDLPESETRYPPEVELHLFRIAQESCENAFHHAHANKVTISGRLDPEGAEIQIADDGTGFKMPGTEALGRLIAQKHFGLAGLIERANLIGGTVQIRTAPGKGTRIQAIWRAKSTGGLSRITP